MRNTTPTPRFSVKSVKSVVAAITAITLVLTLGIGWGVIRAHPSDAHIIQPVGPFEIQYVVSNPQLLPVRYRLTYQSAREWVLTTVDGGEETGYYMRSERDGTVTAGYPQWKEPVVLSGPTNRVTSPSPYFVPRTPQLSGVVKSGSSEFYISKVSIDLGLDRSQLGYFEAAGENIVYSTVYGIPLSISYKDAGKTITTFRVIEIMP